MKHDMVVKCVDAVTRMNEPTTLNNNNNKTSMKTRQNKNDNTVNVSKDF